MKMLTHLSLFSGIGGLDLAAEAAGFDTVGQCEWADYPAKILEKHWPEVPRWKDIRSLTKEDFYVRTGLRTVDIISGGFPCQPFSVAGKQKGKRDDRYLWPEMLRVIRELKPNSVIGENVPGILRIAAGDVVADLEREGYDVVMFDFEAAAVGAWHRRERIAFVGYTKHDGSSSSEIGRIDLEDARNVAERKVAAIESSGASKPWGDENVADADGDGWSDRKDEEYTAEAGKYAFGELTRRCEAMADSESKQDWRLQQREFQPDVRAGGQDGAMADAEMWREHGEQQVRSETRRLGRVCGDVPDAIDGRGTVRRNGEFRAAEEAGEKREYYRRRAEEHVLGERWIVEPNVGRVAHGVSRRVDRLKCLGNAVVPQQFYPIFKAVADEMREMKNEKSKIKIRFLSRFTRLAGLAHHLERELQA